MIKNVQNSIIFEKGDVILDMGKLPNLRSLQFHLNSWKQNETGESYWNFFPLNQLILKSFYDLFKTNLRIFP